MKWPESLVALIDYGIVDEVLRPLMSGKEAQVFLVRCGAEERVAKVYKEAEGRSFRQRADYTEGRKRRNSRDQRAVDKRTRHGRAQDEAAWRGTEVERIRRLRSAGVRVPEPHEFVDGVLVMELVKNAEGEPASRLGDLSFDASEARAIYDTLIRETVRMLAADIVHGDLSEFNVLMAADGPVIIDFPQAVDPTSNRNARKLLLRDVQNLHRFVARYDPGYRVRPLGEEMWKLYEGGKLKADTVLRGSYRGATGPTDTGAVLALIEDAKQDALLERSSRRDDADALDDEPSDYPMAKMRPSAPSDATSGGARDEAPAPRKRVVDFTAKSGGAAKNRRRPRQGEADTKSRSPDQRADSGARSSERPKRNRRSGRSRDAQNTATDQSRPDDARAAARSSAPSAPEETSREPARKRRRGRRGRKPAAAGQAAAPAEAESGKRRGSGSSSTTSGQAQDSSRGTNSGERKRPRRRRRRRPAEPGPKQS